MPMRCQTVLILFLGSLVVGCGKRSTEPAPVVKRQQTADSGETRTVRLKFEGFTKSKSGATWMAWPNKVKKALEGLEGVREIRMVLENDEFVVSFDPTTVNQQKLLLASKEAGFPAYVIADTTKSQDSKFFTDALARARSEKKPIVIDFTATWCVPCQRMLNETFPDDKVAPLLARCEFIKVDADEHPALSQQYGVVGLPDVRLLTSDAREVRRLRDYQSPDEFAKALTELLAKQESLRDETDTTDLITLSANESELKEAFNREVGSVRLLLVLSPTWDPCLDGARVVRDEILRMFETDKLKVYIVWTPVLLEDNRESAIKVTELIQDDRATHFWDEDKSVGNMLGKVVTLPRKRKLAWDVYFVYDAKAEWKDDSPTPTDWMHQLGNDERLLDANKFRASVSPLVESIK